LELKTGDSRLGTIKIADFGLAKRLGSDGLTNTGDFVGTPSYAAPEQAAGREVGPAADVWALGAILYQMLTGRPPFVGDGAVEILDQVRFADPVPPSRLRPNLPRDLETIALACLRKDPARRYPSATALADDLARFLNGEPVRARPVGVAEQAAKWCRRRPALAGTLAAFITLAAGSLIVVTALWQRAVRARDAEGRARQDEVAARMAERAEYERAEARGAGLLIANARYAWMTDDLDAARKALAECPVAYRNDDWAYLNRACWAGQVLVGPATVPPEAIAVSPDGTRIAGGSATESVRVWEAGTGRELAHVRLPSRSIWSIEFMPDGRLAAATGYSDLTGAKRRDVAELVVIDPATRRFRTAWTLPERPRVFVVAPGGTRAAWAMNASNVASVRETDATEPAFQFECKTGVITRLAFSRTGRFLVTGGLPGEVAVRDLEAGGRTQRLDFPPGFFGFTAIGVAGDGRRAAVSGGMAPQSSADLFLLNPGVEPRRISSQFPIVIGCQFSPDGRRVLAFCGSDPAIRVWDVATGREEIVLRGLPTHVRCAAFTPDGRQIVAGYRDGRVVVWTVDPNGPGEQ
jgi:hypothetical protein